jgi:hypothetical protein
MAKRIATDTLKAWYQFVLKKDGTYTAKGEGSTKDLSAMMAQHASTSEQFRNVLLFALVMLYGEEDIDFTKSILNKISDVEHK